MGHGCEAMVRRVYGHLGQVRHRAEAVEYRVEQFADRLEKQLAALTEPGSFVTTCLTTGLDRQLDRVSDCGVTPRA